MPSEHTSQEFGTSGLVNRHEEKPLIHVKIKTNYIMVDVAAKEKP